MSARTFEDHLLGRGLAPRTVAEYGKWVRRWQRWAWSQRLDDTANDPAALRRWAESEVRNSWASRKMAAAALKHWLVFNGHHDGWEGIRVPRKPTKRTRPLEPEQAARLRDTALLVGGRKGLATLCGLYLAARRVEIAGLRWDGWDGDWFEFERTKVHDTHRVPVHPVLAAELDRAKADAWSPWLFPGNGRPHVEPGTVWAWVTEVGRVAGIDVRTHQLRATALTTALDATQDLRTVMDLAGHRDPAVTAGYTRTTERQLRRIVASLDYGTGTEDDR